MCSHWPGDPQRWSDLWGKEGMIALRHTCVRSDVLTYIDLGDVNTSGAMRLAGRI